MSIFGVVDLFCPFCGKPFRYDQARNKGYFHSSEWGVLCSKPCFDAGQRAYGRMILGQDTLHTPEKQ